MRPLGWGVLLGLAIALPSMSAAASSPFADLNDHPMAAAATLLAERRILTGASSMEYGGTLPLTRYDAAEVLNGLLDPRDIPFNIIAWPDVPPGHPAMQAVTRVTSLNLLSGRSAGRFEGMQRIRRQEFVESLDRLLSYRSAPPPPRRAGGLTAFSDVPMGTPTGQLLHRAANVWQFLDNPRRGPFRPNDPLTRFDTLAMLIKAAPLLDPNLEDAMREIVAAMPAPEPAPTARPTAAPTPRPTPAPMRTPAPTATPMPVQTAKPAAMPSPQPTRTPLPTPKPPDDDWPEWLPRPSSISTPAPSAPPSSAPLPSSPTPAPSLQPTPAPTVKPSPAPSAAPSAIPSTRPSAKSSPQPSRTPTPSSAEGPRATLLENRFRAGYSMRFFYLEGLPASSDMIAPGDQGDLSGNFIGSLGVGGQYWLGPWGGALHVDAAGPIAIQATNLLDLTMRGEGFYRLPWRGSDWEAGAGLGTLVRLVNGGGETYQTTSKFSFGLGPAGTFAFIPAPQLRVALDAQLYPLIIQTYGLPEGSKFGARNGLGYQAGVEYALMPLGRGTLSAGLVYQGFLGMLYDFSGQQVHQGLTATIGGTF